MNGSQAKEEVSQLIQGLCSMLEEKRASLLQAIEECQQERLASLHYQIQEHQAMLENSGMVGYAQEVLKETDHPCFVQAAKQLHNRYRVGGPAWVSPRCWGWPVPEAALAATLMSPLSCAAGSSGPPTHCRASDLQPRPPSATSSWMSAGS